MCFVGKKIWYGSFALLPFIPLSTWNMNVMPGRKQPYCHCEAMSMRMHMNTPPQSCRPEKQKFSGYLIAPMSPCTRLNCQPPAYYVIQETLTCLSHCWLCFQLLVTKYMLLPGEQGMDAWQSKTKNFHQRYWNTVVPTLSRKDTFQDPTWMPKTRQY